jgi:enoyl-CoA hydratase
MRSPARGPHFSVGLDLKAMAGMLTGGAGDGASSGDVSAAENGSAKAHQPSMASRAVTARQGVLRMQSSVSAVAACPKPVIAAIHGYCIGGGVDLTSACDIRLCSADAVFSVRETRMAMVADLGSLQRLPELMPSGYVAELAYTGRDVDAVRAERMGFVNEVFPDRETTLEAAQQLAAEIAANSPLAVQGTKAVLAEARRARVEAGLRFVAAWNAGQLRSDDLDEAVTAFFERRPPKFTGG